MGTLVPRAGAMVLRFSVCLFRRGSGCLKKQKQKETYPRSKTSGKTKSPPAQSPGLKPQKYLLAARVSQLSAVSTGAVSSQTSAGSDLVQKLGRCSSSRQSEEGTQGPAQPISLQSQEALRPGPHT